MVHSLPALIIQLDDLSLLVLILLVAGLISHYLGKNYTKITFISEYQVCNQSLQQGQRIATTTATAQQTRMLRDSNCSLSPHQAFISDLKQFFGSLLSQHHEDLVAGDFNEPLSSQSSGMTKLATDLGLTDLMYQLIGHNNFNTHLRGSQRIDYILCTEHIADAAQAGCYEPFQYRVKGDHRSMIIHFDLLGLFGNPTHHIASPSQREFHSTDVTMGKKNISHKHKYLHNEKFSS